MPYTTPPHFFRNWFVVALSTKNLNNGTLLQLTPGKTQFLLYLAVGNALGHVATLDLGFPHIYHKPGKLYLSTKFWIKNPTKFDGIFRQNRKDDIWLASAKGTFCSFSLYHYFKQ